MGISDLIFTILRASLPPVMFGIVMSMITVSMVDAFARQDGFMHSRGGFHDLSGQDPGEHDDWLDPENRDPGRLTRILQGGWVRKLKRDPVSTRANSPAHNDPACIEPLGVER